MYYLDEIKMNACEGLMVLDIKVMVFWDVKLYDQVFYILTLRLGISSGAVMLL